MEKDSKIYIAGHTGLVGSALVRKFTSEGYTNLVYTPYPEYDLRNQQQTNDFFKREKPEYVIIAAAKISVIRGQIRTSPPKSLHRPQHPRFIGVATVP